MAAIALMVSACDKIEPDADGNYTTYAGPKIEWSDTVNVEITNPKHNALVEKYTGPRCTNCPTADEALDNLHHTLGDRLVTVAITHYEEAPLLGLDTRTNEGEQWGRYFGITFRPTAMLNRTNGDGQWDLFTGTSAISAMSSDVNAAIGQTPKVALEATAARQADSVQLTIDLEVLANLSVPLNVTVAITEDSLRYPQMTPNDIDEEYPHNHILRKVITDIWGSTVTTSATAGKSYQGRVKFGLGSVSVPQNAHIVVFATDANTREVLNVTQCDID